MRSILLLLLVLVSCWAADEVKVPKGAKATATSAALLDGTWKVGIEAMAGGPDLTIACNADGYTCTMSEKVVGSGKLHQPIACTITTADGVNEYTGGQLYTLKDGSVVIIGMFRWCQISGNDPTTGDARPTVWSKPVKWTAYSRRARD